MGGLGLLSMSVAVAAEPGVNALDYPGGAWPPYVVGAGIGVLSWLTFFNRPHQEHHRRHSEAIRSNCRCAPTKPAPKRCSNKHNWITNG